MNFSNPSQEKYALLQEWANAITRINNSLDKKAKLVDRMNYYCGALSKTNELDVENEIEMSKAISKEHARLANLYKKQTEILIRMKALETGESDNDT